MNFLLSDEHIMLRKMIQEFAIHEVEPTAVERDVAEYWDMNIWRKISDLGITGIPWIEKYGGAESNFLSYILAVEELCKVDASIGVALSAHCSLASWPIHKFGTGSQKETYLRPLAEGTAIGAYCYAEQGASYDEETLQTEAVLQGDEWILNGVKHFVINGGYANVLIVFAQTGPCINRTGITAFIVKNPSPGLTIGKKISKMGIRSTSTIDILFKDCHIPKANVLGQIGDGYHIAMQTLALWHNAIAAGAIGIAEGALQRAVAYAKARVQFGKQISKMQAIQFKLADMATRLDAARWLTYQTTWREDEGLRSHRESAMCKKFASDMAMEVTINAIQLHGGYGYTREYVVERYMRDAKFMQIDEGILNLIIRSEW